MNQLVATFLLLIGGGTRPPEAMKAFVQASGGENARILIFSWASATTEGAENIKNELALSKPASITIMPTFPMPADQESKLISTIQSATGIFFTGGDQNELVEAITKEKLKTVFKNAYASGVAFAGTSAGTAVMSERMITGDTTVLAEGLGLLPYHIVVDQHFIVRHRFDRLAQVVLKNENTTGLAIDEGAAVIIRNSVSAEVLGPCQALLIKKESANKVSVEYFKVGESFNLH